MSKWCEFANHRSGCFVYDYDKWSKEDSDESGRLDPEKVRDRCRSVCLEKVDELPSHIYSLPYDANPIINPEVPHMAFCHDPENCKGRGSCPRAHACND